MSKIKLFGEWFFLFIFVLVRDVFSIRNRKYYYSGNRLIEVNFFNIIILEVGVCWFWFSSLFVLGYMFLWVFWFFFYGNKVVVIILVIMFVFKVGGENKRF